MKHYIPRTLIILGGLSIAAHAEEPQKKIESLAPLSVIGGSEEIQTLVGSAAFLDAEEFRARGYTNIEQVTRKIPGVYVRDEDGFGNFPNISLRGVDGSRTQKVTIMEDNILTAPSPYSAPNAYYFPRVGRMAGVELLKGSSQIRFGPQTTGGVMNFLTTEIPTEADPRFYSRTTFGSFNTFLNHTWYGDVLETESGKLGVLFEMFTNTTDGFRNIDGVGRASGFAAYEPMLKVSFEPNSALKQRFEFKLGFSDFDTDETYTGLTETDLRRNPDRRYAATAFDSFTSEHIRSYLKWIANPTDFLRVESAVYYNQFRRNWDKVDGVFIDGIPGTRSNVNIALANPAGARALQGLQAGSIVENRDAFRKHDAYGWQNQANIQFDTAQIEHDLAVGLRLHYDRSGGSNTNIRRQSTGDGNFNAPVTLAATSAGLGEVFATAVYLEDNMKIGALTLSPGIRYEHLDVKNTTSAGLTQSTSEYLIMGGMGLNYEFDARNALFGGVYRGMAPANPGGFINGTESEESLGFELGYRHRQQGFMGEITAFVTEFDNLIAPEVGTGLGGLTPARNAGGAEVWGIESIATYDYAEHNNLGFNLPMYASLTYTNARFARISGNRLGNGAGLFAGAINGAEIPYIPEWRFATGVGYDCGQWGINLDMSYSASTWGTGWNGRTRENDNGTPAAPSAVDGRVDSFLVFDLSGHYQLKENIRLIGGIQNLFDERALVSRAPLGPRANAPRIMFAGIEATF